MLDSGLLLGATAQHSWLAGVTGEYEDPLIGTPPRILAYVGHGTFVAGVAATMAPKASIKVARTFRLIGAKYESDLVMDAVAALKQGAEIISLAFGTNTRKDIASLGFEIVGEQLKNYPGVVLVAAAGNGSVKTPVLAGGLRLDAVRGRAGRELAQPGVLHQLRALGGCVRAGRGGWSMPMPSGSTRAPNRRMPAR